MQNKKTCLTCGRTVIIRQNRWERAKYCSNKCGAPARSLLSGEKSRQAAESRRAAISQPSDYRLVSLTRGALTKVDVEDFDLGSSFNWACSDTGYARRTMRVEGSRRNERLHRRIMERVLGRELSPFEQVDHINGDRLDNRRRNLRLASCTQNSYNVRRTNKLGFMGVARNHDRFFAKITVQNNSFHIGTFDTPAEAAWMRDQWAMELHGDFASLNFEYV